MKIITLNVDECRALGDPIRATIANILYHKTLTTEDIVKELAKYNYKKAVPTIRHHIDILKNANIIEVAYTKEKRGTLEKYYRSKIKFLGFNNAFIELNGTSISDISKKLAKIIDIIVKKHLEEYEEHKCEYCNIDHTKEYIIAEIIEYALAEALDR
jgi:DNA-binding transcriptional ArsR family regulator